MGIVLTITPILKIFSITAVFFVWFIRYDNIVKEFEKYKYSPKLRDLVGILKIGSVILIQTSSPLNIKVGSAILAFLMLAAFITHIKVKNPFLEMVPSFLLFTFSLIFFFGA